MRYIVFLFFLISIQAQATSYAVCDFTEGSNKGVARIGVSSLSMQFCSSKTSSDCKFIFSGQNFPTIDERIELKSCHSLINDTISSGAFIRFWCEPDLLYPKYLDLEAHGHIDYFNAGYLFRHYDPAKNEIVEKYYKFENCELF